jgi:hypothetical protein
MRMKGVVLAVLGSAILMSWLGCSSSSSTAPGTCPTQTPEQGASCSLASGTKCTYGCESTPGVATCDGTWNVQLIGTVCPAPDAATHEAGAGDAGACPATMPKAGASCVTGKSCTYDCSNQGPSHETGLATCSGSKWTVQLTGIVCLDAG